MALSLRDLLDKQRAEREARECGGGGATPASPVAVNEQPTKPEPQPVPVSHSQNVGNPQPTKRSMFSSLAGVDAPNVAQTETARPSQASPATTQLPIQEGRPANATANGSGGPSPAFSDDETETLRKNLAFLAANLDEKEIIGQVLRTTVRQIQQHPELNAIMIDSDFDLIIAAARRSTKFVQRKKEDKADVKATKKNKKDELDQWLKDQGIDLG